MKLTDLVTEFTEARFVTTRTYPCNGDTLTTLVRSSDNAFASVLSLPSESVYHVALHPNNEINLAQVLRNQISLNGAKIDSILHNLSAKIIAARASYRHLYREPKYCTCMESSSCLVCVGGLGLCALCGHIEGSLTTDCPGSYTYPNYGDSVYAGEIDFQNGAWVPGACSPHTPAKYHKS